MSAICSAIAVGISRIIATHERTRARSPRCARTYEDARVRAEGEFEEVRQYAMLAQERIGLDVNCMAAAMCIAQVRPPPALCNVVLNSLAASVENRMTLPPTPCVIQV